MVARGKKVRLISKTSLPRNDPAIPAHSCEIRAPTIVHVGFNNVKSAGPPRANFS